MYAVQVLPAPSEVTLSASQLDLGVKQSVTLTPSITDGTHASFKWYTKDETIAAVSQEGGKTVGAGVVSKIIK